MMMMMKLTLLGSEVTLFPIEQKFVGSTPASTVVFSPLENYSMECSDWVLMSFFDVLSFTVLCIDP